MGNTTGCSPSGWRQSFGRQPAHASFLLPTIFPYRPKDDSFGRCPGTGSLNEAAYPCLSRMRGQLARPVLRGARVSNDPRLIDGMRLELLRKAVVMPVTYQEYLADSNGFGPMQCRVSRLRNALWRGRSWRALLQFARLRGDIDRWAAEHPGRCAQSVRRAKQVIKEFRYYVCGNRRSLPDFAKQRAAGHRISTAHVESVMNHLVNHRLSKKQQMRWSPEGAHYLLQVRAEMLNGTLLDGYRIANPRFRQPSGFSYAA